MTPPTPLAAHQPRNWPRLIVTWVDELGLIVLALIGLIDLSETLLIPKIRQLTEALRPDAPSVVLLVKDDQGRLKSEFPLRIRNDNGDETILITNEHGFAPISGLSAGTYQAQLVNGDSSPSRFTLDADESAIIAVTVAPVPGPMAVVR